LDLYLYDSLERDDDPQQVNPIRCIGCYLMHDLRGFRKWEPLKDNESQIPNLKEEMNRYAGES